MTLPGQSTPLRDGENYFLYSSVSVLICLCLYESSHLSLCVYLQAFTCFWKGQRFDCILVFYSTFRYECRQPTIQHLLPAADLIFRNITNVHVSNTLATAATRTPPFFPSAPPLNHNSGSLGDIVTYKRYVQLHIKLVHPNNHIYIQCSHLQ